VVQWDSPQDPTKPMPTPKIGEKITTWFSDREDRLSTVLEVLPYTGKYVEMFDCVLRLSAPRTKAGSLEMAFDSSCPCR
jgi:hypothetical protein